MTAKMNRRKEPTPVVVDYYAPLKGGTPPAANTSQLKSGYTVQIPCGMFRVTRVLFRQGTYYRVMALDATGEFTVEIHDRTVTSVACADPSGKGMGKPSACSEPILKILDEQRRPVRTETIAIPAPRPDRKSCVGRAKMWSNYQPVVSHFYYRHMRSYGAERKHAA